MLTAERRQYILKRLQRDGKVVAKHVSEELGLSEDTIRRDLRDLASEGLLLRVHGGALPSSPAKADFSARKEQSSSAKAEIAAAAAQLIRNGQVVLLDGGTTNIQVIQHLAPDVHATIVTNSPPLAAVAAEHPLLDVIMLGGQLYKHSIVTMGTATLNELHMIRADLYLLGICSLHPEIGISTENLEEAYLKREMMACSAEVVALVSPEKLNTAAPSIVGPIKDLSEIITTSNVPEDVLAPYQALGVTITLA